MRIFLLKASCILLSAFLICGKSSLAYCQHIVAGLTTLQPVFISGMLMNHHSKDTTIANLVTAQKNAEKPMAGSAGEKKTPEELINYIIKKNAAPDTKDAATTIKEPTATEIKDTNANAVSNPIAETKTETAPAREAKQISITITEKNTREEAPALMEEEVDPLINKYAEMISVEPQDISNYPLYRFIDKWYGTRYKWGGIDSTGIDCSAFSQKLYGQIYGLDILRTAREQHHSSSAVKHYLDANEGDLIFFRIHRLRISHVGVYLANGYFVHASRSHGVMISSLNDRYWSRRYAGCGKVEREDRTISESDFTTQ
jgi:cell wall-associated NlpC family hydrolase